MEDPFSAKLFSNAARLAARMLFLRALPPRG